MTKHRTPDELTKERGEVYGHPLEYFNTLEQMMAIWRKHSQKSGKALTGFADQADHHDTTLVYSRAIEGAVYSILGKLVRLATTSTHRDSIQDIAGYAKTLEMCLDRLEQNQSAIVVNAPPSKLKPDSMFPNTFDVRPRSTQVIDPYRPLGDGT